MKGDAWWHRAMKGDAWWHLAMKEDVEMRSTNDEEQGGKSLPLPTLLGVLQPAHWRGGSRAAQVQIFGSGPRKRTLQQPTVGSCRDTVLYFLHHGKAQRKGPLSGCIPAFRAPAPVGSPGRIPKNKGWDRELKYCTPWPKPNDDVSLVSSITPLLSDISAIRRSTRIRPHLGFG